MKIITVMSNSAGFLHILNADETITSTKDDLIENDLIFRYIFARLAPVCTSLMTGNHLSWEF